MDKIRLNNQTTTPVPTTVYKDGENPKIGIEVVMPKKFDDFVMPLPIKSPLFNFVLFQNFKFFWMNLHQYYDQNVDHRDRLPRERTPFWWNSNETFVYLQSVAKYLIDNHNLERFRTIGPTLMDEMGIPKSLQSNHANNLFIEDVYLVDAGRLLNLFVPEFYKTKHDEVKARFVFDMYLAVGDIFNSIRGPIARNFTDAELAKYNLKKSFDFEKQKEEEEVDSFDYFGEFWTKTKAREKRETIFWSQVVCSNDECRNCMNYLLNGATNPCEKFFNSLKSLESNEMYADVFAFHIVRFIIKKLVLMMIYEHGYADTLSDALKKKFAAAERNNDLMLNNFFRNYEIIITKCGSFLQRLL